MRPREGPETRLMTPSEAAAMKIAHATTETLRSERDRLFNTIEQQATLIKKLEVHLRTLQGAVGWQITDKRVIAIRDAKIALRDSVADSNDPRCWAEELATLETMLEEARR